MRIPSSAPPDQQQSFRELWAAVDALRAKSGTNLDLGGQRVINAGDAVQGTDYVTKRQVAALAPPPTPPDSIDVNDLTVRQRARILGKLYLPRLTDGSAHHVILFVDANGAVSGVNDGGATFAFNDALSFLELGFDMRIKWVAGLASIGSAIDGIINLLNHAGDNFLRLVLGLDDGTGIAITKNGSTFELRIAGGGALTDLVIDDLTADVVGANTVNATTVNATTVNASNVPVNGGNAAFASVAVGTDPGGAEILRVGGSERLTGNLNCDGQVGATAFNTNGHAGVNFGPGAIASITIENGIVTSAS